MTKDPLLQPFTLKGVTLKNRIMSTAHAPAYAVDAMPKEQYQRYHEEKARGGMGMTMFGGSSCVSSDTPSVFGQLDVSGDRIIPYFQQFSGRIKAHDCAIMCQISHLGRRTTWNAGDWLPVVAPSRIREPQHRGFPKEMDQADIDRVIADYAAAARRCKEGGLDGVEILTNCHLPGQFMSSDLNFRTDKYGGSFENRMRFTLEMLEAVKAEVGSDFIVGIRAEMEAGFEGGLSAEEGLASLQMIQSEGLTDFVNLNVGRSDTDLLLATFAVPSMHQKLSPWLQLAGAFKRELKLPVFHACRISDLATARYAIEESLLDLVGMTRAHIADPHITRKILEGREDRIRSCVGAGYCIDRIYNEGAALCIQNPATGREETQSHEVTPTTGPRKKVAVIGGGPAGMEAARVSAERGHEVTLFEASDRLGGQVLLAAKASWRKDLIGISDWLIAELEHSKVDIQFNQMIEGAELSGFDIVVVATGGLPDTDIVEGAERAGSVWDALAGEAVSGSVLIYDDNGQHQAVSCADWLSKRDDIELELVTPDRHVAAEMGFTNAPIYMKNLYANGARLTTDHRLKRVEAEGNRIRAVFENEFTKQESSRTVDHLLIEHGTLPNDELYHALKDSSANKGITDVEALIAETPQPTSTGFQLYRIGDAVASRNIHAALYDARRLCQHF